MNLVIVDDDVLVTTALKTILEAQGKGEISVTGIGHNGNEAISLYRSLNPDVLLMDIRMKEKSGLGCCPGNPFRISKGSYPAAHDVF